MQTVRVNTGAMPETPLFSVYLCALRGARALKVQIQAERLDREKAVYCDKFDSTIYHASDRAISLALKSQDAPYAAFVAVYLENVTPELNCRYGAPMGRQSGALDHSDYSLWRAKAVPLDNGGYDRGGAYWGCRERGKRLYAVQDGMGSLVFVDAKDGKHAIAVAQEGE